ncbi:hemin uptake protein HemP [Aquisalimonas lutea]|uniref:hemin uptake protein HemP n=1 Tax=Aquisalimonas lutea TaxID=1327750 RepID=UPI0025B4DD05|nr:hemin uptake protein HemP [Aquisalimonas lutea]MDN3518693.1 hemin uptake protein HemP [Aquisalimonas lutea]
MESEREAEPHDHKGDVREDETIPGDGDTPRIDSRELFGDAREVIIVHDQQNYRLRRTRTEKLILTK